MYDLTMPMVNLAVIFVQRRQSLKTSKSPWSNQSETTLV
jgi:hypothetical protein